MIARRLKTAVAVGTVSAPFPDGATARFFSLVLDGGLVVMSR